MELSIISNKLNVQKTSTMIIKFALVATVISLTGSALIGAVLGVSAVKVYYIAKTAYTAWKTGASIRVAVAAMFVGPGWLIDLAVELLICYGIGLVLNSTHLQAL